MLEESLFFTSAIELARLFRARDLSPVELVAAVLERASQLHGSLNCFITLTPERAMEEARMAEARFQADQPLGVLDGIPFSVKDLVNTADVRTTFGTLVLKENVPSADTVSVARLRDAGAILIGKTTTPEFGSGPLTNSPLFGSTRNPWNLDRTCGGSSGGAAAAIAAGIAPLAVATDGGGSTRIPAACCGVVGFKQSIGVIPHGQAQDIFSNQTYVTPMTRDVMDTALMLDVMRGSFPLDPWSVGLRDQDYVSAARRPGTLVGKRVLYCAVPPGRIVAQAVQQVFDAALTKLTGLGAIVEPFDGEGFNVEPIWRAINHTMWRARFQGMVEKAPAQFSEAFKRQLASASAISGVDYLEAMFARSELFKRVQCLFERADFLVMPTLTRSALPLRQELFDPIEIDGAMRDGLRGSWYPWTMLFNMTGHPAVSLPMGLDREGMPLGLQLVGRLQGDADLIGAASLFEQEARCVPSKPSLASLL